MTDKQQAGATGTKRTVHRSPNFPSLSLPDALSKVRTVYTHDKRAPVSPQVILGHLGYGKSMSGSAGRVLSAMRQYGLLEDVDGSVRVSETAFRILTLSEQSPERLTAIRSAAQKPAIFREVLAEYPDGLPSDVALRDWLISRKEFNPASVDVFIRSFKATIEFAKLGSPVYTEPDRGSADAAAPPARETEAMTPNADFAGSPARETGLLIPPMSWVLSVPRGVRAELKIVGSDVKVSDLQRLKAQIDFLVQSFMDEEASDPPSKGGESDG